MVFNGSAKTGVKLACARAALHLVDASSNGAAGATAVFVAVATAVGSPSASIRLGDSAPLSTSLKVVRFLKSVVAL